MFDTDGLVIAREFLRRMAMARKRDRKLKASFTGRQALRAAVVLLAAMAIASAALIVTRNSSAATPATGAISVNAPVFSYDAGPFVAATQLPLGLGQLDQGPRCDDTTFPCDSFTLTVS